MNGKVGERNLTVFSEVLSNLASNDRTNLIRLSRIRAAASKPLPLLFSFPLTQQAIRHSRDVHSKGPGRGRTQDRRMDRVLS